MSPEQSAELQQLKTNQPVVPMMDCSFTVDELLKALKDTKNTSAPSLDGISYRALKRSPPAVHRSLTRLYNYIWLTGEMPDEWQKSFITPLFKAGDPLNAGNYRGIAISSCLMKLFHNMIHNRLYTLWKITTSFTTTKMVLKREHTLSQTMSLS